ncbi:histidine kinase [Saccharibacillus qingshengii]|uniref:ATP-binding protein n=1 Tax=Saccharibacillus qingshengii TaxID=1763540 RepID=UPI001551E294|nr:histidine kinase [Saccharibacillus qingshengii]
MRFAIRGVLILISAAAGLYTAPSGEIKTYVAGVLLFAALTAAERLGLPERLRTAFQVVQILISFWLVERFGPALLFLSLSSLPGYMQSDPFSKGLMAAGHLLALNLALAGAEISVRLNANLAFLLSAVLLLMLEISERRRLEDVVRYDELRMHHFELGEERERLAAFALRIEEEAQDEERVRLARKLHDDIGHRLIRIKMMMEAAMRILPTERERASGMLEQIRRQLEESMEEIRLSVKKGTTVSRAEHEYALDRLLDDTGRETGMRTTYRIQGIPYALYPSYRVALYQNARESLTNALRHGRAEYIELTLIYEPDAVTTKVCSGQAGDIKPDDLQTQAAPTVRAGMGIRGMTERTRHLGGELRIDPGPPFTVVTRLPIRTGTTE